MSETEWLAGESSRKLIAWLPAPRSERKLRLFACAYWRWDNQWDGGDSREMVQALKYAEYWAEHGLHPETDSGLSFPPGYRWHPLMAKQAFDAASWTARNKRSYQRCTAPASAEMQLRLLRDIFGNPLRPVTVDPAWLTATVISLAQAIYDERAFDRLPILADALEDAGCDNADILNHCRQPGEHVRGCWALELVLGKS